MKAWELFDKMLKASKPLNVSAEKAKERDAAFAAQEPGAIHREPDCLGYNRCRYMEPHKHGFSCDKTCTECWGICHPDCPANDTIKKEK
jgi:hypothetical protein